MHELGAHTPALITHTNLSDGQHDGLPTYLKLRVTDEGGSQWHLGLPPTQGIVGKGARVQDRAHGEI